MLVLIMVCAVKGLDGVAASRNLTEMPRLSGTWKSPCRTLLNDSLLHTSRAQSHQPSAHTCVIIIIQTHQVETKLSLVGSLLFGMFFASDVNLVASDWTVSPDTSSSRKVGRRATPLIPRLPWMRRQGLCGRLTRLQAWWWRVLCRLVPSIAKSPVQHRGRSPNPPKNGSTRLRLALCWNKGYSPQRPVMIRPAIIYSFSNFQLI